MADNWKPGMANIEGEGWRTRPTLADVKERFEQRDRRVIYEASVSMVRCPEEDFVMSPESDKTKGRLVEVWSLSSLGPTDMNRWVYHIVKPVWVDGYGWEDDIQVEIRDKIWTEGGWLSAMLTLNYRCPRDYYDGKRMTLFE